MVSTGCSPDQGCTWYPAWETNTDRLRIGLRGNHSAPSKSATAPLVSKLDRLDQHHKISQELFKIQNTQYWRTGLLEWKNMFLWIKAFYLVYFFQPPLSPHMHTFDGALYLQHLPPFHDAARNPWLQCHYPNCILLGFSALALKRAVQICFMTTSAWMWGWQKGWLSHERITGSYSHPWRVLTTSYANIHQGWFR